MIEWRHTIEELIARGFWIDLIQAAIILALGLALTRVLPSMTERALRSRLTPHAEMVVRRTVFYTVLTLTIATVLHQLGFRLGVLLGAAGVVSVAIGFASQTSASNLISGLFLMGERSFGKGDVIKVGDTVGEVLSIDLLSVKLRTSDNLFVRIPNESLIKSQVTNMSRFATRRADLKLRVSYREDLGKVRSVLMAVADANPLCLKDPKPVFMVLGFGEWAIDLQLNVWARSEHVLELRNSLQQQIKEAFKANGIEIPLPHLSLQAPGDASPSLESRGESAAASEPRDRSSP